MRWGFSDGFKSSTHQHVPKNKKYFTEKNSEKTGFLNLVKIFFSKKWINQVFFEVITCTQNDYDWQQHFKNYFNNYFKNNL